MLLKLPYNLIHNLDIRMPLALRLADLLRVAAALGDEVVAACPAMLAHLAFQMQSQSSFSNANSGPNLEEDGRKYLHVEHLDWSCLEQKAWEIVSRPSNACAVRLTKRAVAA
jgi:hypothetical protein